MEARETTLIKIKIKGCSHSLGIGCEGEETLTRWHVMFFANSDRHGKFSNRKTSAPYSRHSHNLVTQLSKFMIATIKS